MKTGRGKKYIIVSIAVVLMLALAVAVVAETARREKFKSPYNAFATESFYFTSPLLADGQTEGSISRYTAEEASGDSYVFNIELRNYTDELHVNTEDIVYTATAENATVSNAALTLHGGAKRTSVLEVRCSYAQLLSGNALVTVKSTSPYEKTLTFHIQAEQTRCNLENNPSAANGFIYPLGDNAAVLTVSYGTIASDIVLSLPQGVAPDMTAAGLEKNADGSYLLTGGQPGGSREIVLLRGENGSFGALQASYAESIENGKAKCSITVS